MIQFGHQGKEKSDFGSREGIKKKNRDEVRLLRQNEIKGISGLLA